MPLGTYLDWDSEFWGRGIARLDDAVLRDHDVEEIAAWCRGRRIECAFLLIDEKDADTRRRADAGPFRLVDQRITLTRPVRASDQSSPGDRPRAVRPSRSDDIPHLRAIARVCHRLTRFYADPGFPSARCHELYETWIEKSCRGYADQVLVGEWNHAPAGYLSCHLREPGLGQIGLFAVAESARGQSLGRQLIVTATEWFARQGVSDVAVATQARSRVARRVYERQGFVTTSVGYWYHLWLAPTAGERR